MNNDTNQNEEKKPVSDIRVTGFSYNEEKKTNNNSNNNNKK